MALEIPLRMQAGGLLPLIPLPSLWLVPVCLIWICQGLRQVLPFPAFCALPTPTLAPSPLASSRLGSSSTASTSPIPRPRTRPLAAIPPASTSRTEVGHEIPPPFTQLARARCSRRGPS